MPIQTNKKIDPRDAIRKKNRDANSGSAKEQDFSKASKEELQEELTNRGIEFKSRDSAKTLLGLLE